MAKNKGKKQFQGKGQRFRGDVWLDQKVSGRTLYALQARGVKFPADVNPRGTREFKDELLLRYFHNRNRYAQHTILLLPPWYRSALDEGNNTVDDDAADRIKNPNENADDQHTGQNDERVVDHLALGGPYDLFQLALHFAEPTADSLPGTHKEVFLFCFCHDFTLSAMSVSLPYFVSL